jgi:hypothetical protein
MRMPWSSMALLFLHVLSAAHVCAHVCAHLSGANANIKAVQSWPVKHGTLFSSRCDCLNVMAFPLGRMIWRCLQESQAGQACKYPVRASCHDSTHMLPTCKCEEY